MYEIKDYQPDDGPLTEEDISRLRLLAKELLPKGKILQQEKLLADANET